MANLQRFESRYTLIIARMFDESSISVPKFAQAQAAKLAASLGIPPQIAAKPRPTKLIDFSIDVDAIEPPQEVKLQVGDVVIILPCIGTTRRGGRIFADPHGGPSHRVNKFDRLHVFSDGSLVVMHHPTPRVD